MPDIVDVVITDTRWGVIDLAGIAEIAAKAAGIPDGYEICVMGCDDTKITDLNTQFRGKPKPTNVLSWPTYELSPERDGGMPTSPPKPMMPDDNLGDIAIAYETCLREAEQKSISVKDHVTHLVLHGCLHLLGYNHETDADAAIMEGIEIKALANIGIDNPY